MRYVIHIGAAKTGTKYLQTSFTETRWSMRQQGIYYPTEGWAGQGLAGHYELFSELMTVPNPKLSGVFAELNACDAQVVLLSSEAFMSLPRKNLEYFQKLIDGSEVKIVFYCRRWSDWLPSMWKTYVRTGHSLATFPELYGRLLANPAREIDINFSISLGAFSEVFGRENVYLVSYSNLIDNGQDIFENFCQEILRWNPGGKPELSKIHESPDSYLSELLRCLHSIQILRRGKTSPSLALGLFNALSVNHDVHRDTQLIMRSMASHVREILLDDNVISFQTVYSEINQKYSDRLTNPEFGSVIFAKGAALFKYASQDYLLEDGVSAAVRRIYEASSAQAPGTPDFPFRAITPLNSPLTKSAQV